MATWHQLKAKTKLYHETQWNVVIDPPNEMRAIVSFSTKDLAEVYMRSLAANNPGAHRYAYIVRPTSAGIWSE